MVEKSTMVAIVAEDKYVWYVEGARSAQQQRFCCAGPRANSTPWKDIIFYDMTIIKEIAKTWNNIRQLFLNLC